MSIIIYWIIISLTIVLTVYFVIAMSAQIKNNLKKLNKIRAIIDTSLLCEKLSLIHTWKHQEKVEQYYDESDNVSIHRENEDVFININFFVHGKMDICVEKGIGANYDIFENEYDVTFEFIKQIIEKYFK